MREQVVSIFETRKKCNMCTQHPSKKKAKLLGVEIFLVQSERVELPFPPSTFAFVPCREKERNKRIHAQSKRPGYGSREIHVYKQKENMG
jgi:hypothetical protein|tara:strand:- start:520 stop:789 length:270 start_codon:yes stop_codon:yes gene_type:complete